MHVLCPHCHNPIETARVTPREEITCPACGSTFRLEGGAATTPCQRAAQKLGRFEVLDRLGSGTFGTVYKARDPQLDRLVAVKVPRGGSLAGPQELDRFLREARSVARLRHPSIVAVHEVGQEDGVPYLVSDLVQGVTLADWLSARRPGFREAAEMVAAVAGALQYAHEQGVVHRDVKPSNIMIGEDGTPCVMDFGLAKRAAGETTMTVEGQVLGTPAYMSPEQAGGESRSVDGRSDVYSLGVVLYQMLTGELPFRGTQRMLLHQVLHDDPKPPRALNDQVPRDLETITLKAMAKEPAVRYATARDFADDLRRWLKGEPIRARPVRPWERAARWARRRPAVAGLLAALALVITTSLVALTALWLRAEEGRAAARRAQGDADAQAARAELESAAALQAAQAARDERNAAAAAKEVAERRRDEARRHLYAAHLALMQGAWQAGAVRRVQQLLDLQEPKGGDPDLRGFEWHYWKRLVDGRLLTLEGHDDTVTAVAFSPNRRRLASASLDRTVRLWELPTGRLVRKLTGHEAGVVGVGFSPDGRLLVSAARDGAVKVWDAATGKERFTLTGQSGTGGGGAFGPDGKRLASAAGEAVKLFETDGGKEVASFPAGPGTVTAVAFAPDGKRIAAAAEGAVRVVPVDGGQAPEPLTGLKVRVVGLEFLPDGKVRITGHDGSLVGWDPAERKAVALSPRQGDEVPTTVGRLGRLVAVLAPAETVRVFDMAGSGELFALRGHTAPITSIAFSSDDERVATGSRDRTVRVWATRFVPEVLHVRGHARQVNAVAFNPDGDRLLTAGSDGTLRLREAETGQELLVIKAHPPAVGWTSDSPDSKFYVAAGIMGAAFSADGRRVATAGGDGLARVWDTSTGALLQTLRGHTSAVLGVAFSPDGTRVATASWDQTVRLWDAADGHELHVLKGHGRQVIGVAFSPDGKRLASGGWDKMARVWDVETGREVCCLSGHLFQVASVCFSPDGRRLATASDPFDVSGEVKVWDTATWQEELSFRGHVYGIYQVAFSRDGSRLATAGCEGSAKLWDARTGQELFDFHDSPDKTHSVALSPDGLRLAIGRRSGAVMLLDASPLTPELLLRREAFRLVEDLYERLGDRAAVLARLRGDADLSEPLRREAMARAERYLRTK
jgi:WD40 repeat protein